MKTSLPRLGLVLFYLAAIGTSPWFLFPTSRGFSQGRMQEKPTPTPLALPQVRIRPEKYQPHDQFGYAVGADGSWLVAGAPGQDGGEDPASEDTGGVYLFEHVGQSWVERSRLAPQSPEAGSRFGAAVGIDGDTIVVGAPYATTSEAGFAAGAVYVFARQGSNWRQQARLVARDGSPFDLFGGALALEGDTLVVGARGVDDPSHGRNAGAAYVFQRKQDAWVEEARLSAKDGAADDFFGHAVALTGDLVGVGAFGQDNPVIGSNTGAAYLFQRYQGAWYAQATLTSAQPEPLSQFGYSLAFMRGAAGPGWLLVGANQYARHPVDPGYESPPGRLELFQWKDAAWQLAATLAREFDARMETGMLGSSLAVGKAGSDRSFIAAGGQLSTSVTLFLEDSKGWKEAGRLAPEEFQMLYGSALASSGSYLAIGSPWSAERIPNGQFFDEIPQSGAVFIIDLTGLH